MWDLIFLHFKILNSALTLRVVHLLMANLWFTCPWTSRKWRTNSTFKLFIFCVSKYFAFVCTIFGQVWQTICQALLKYKFNSFINIPDNDISSVSEIRLARGISSVTLPNLLWSYYWCPHSAWESGCFMYSRMNSIMSGWITFLIRDIQLHGLKNCRYYAFRLESVWY